MSKTHGKTRARTRGSTPRTRVTSPTVLTDTAEAVEKNILFSCPWKKSDIILEVDGREFHVHRCILTMQSPVFEAMLDGQFREAKQTAITLKGKTSEDMLQFLKLLYPASMITKPLIPFDDESILKILRLADEFQAEDVMRYLLKNVNMITKSNALELIPYATKYDGEVRKKCINVVSSEMRMNILEKKLPAIEAEQPELVKELLIAKCRYLEKFEPKSINPVPTTTGLDSGIDWRMCLRDPNAVYFGRATTLDLFQPCTKRRNSNSLGKNRLGY